MIYEKYLSIVGIAHNIRVLVGNAHPTYMFKNQIVVL
jgi:hypothetical protein